MFFIPLIPLTKTGAARPVPDLQDQVRHRGAQAARPPAALQLALVGRDARPGHRHPPGSATRAARSPAAARSRPWPATGERGYDEAALDADLAEPADERRRPRSSRFGSQLQVEAREWYLAEAIRIALADGPLTAAERAATGHLASALGMTQAQAIGVIALTEQNAGQS